MSPAPRTCLLFTKQFPYGNLENYLFNELPFLKAGFDRVVIVPVDEHNFDESKNRLSQLPEFEVLKLNQPDFASVKLSRYKRECAVASAFLKELFRSRERLNMWRRRKHLFATMRHLYRSAVLLNHWIREQGLTPSDAVCYHYWFHNGLMITWLMETYCGGIRLPQVARAHSGDLYHRDWNLIRNQSASEAFVPFEQIKWRQADKVWVISDHGYRFVQERFPSHLGKTGVARLGVTDHGWTPREPASDLRTIVSCSQLLPNKRLHLLPEILSNLPFPIRWIHFGEGTDAAKDHVRKLMVELCPKSSVEFAGVVPNHVVIAFYRSNPVDLIVNLSLSEGIPVALMEAASFGIPMLATDTVGNPEIVNDDNGILIPIMFDSADVTKRVLELFTNPQQWKMSAAAARSTFETRYNARSNYSVFTEMLLKNLAPSAKD